MQQSHGIAIIERMCQRHIGLNPLDRRTGVVKKSGECQRFGARTTADSRSSLINRDLYARARQRYRRAQAVWSTADNDCPLHTHSDAQDNLP